MDIFRVVEIYIENVTCFLINFPVFPVFPNKVDISNPAELAGRQVAALSISIKVVLVQISLKKKSIKKNF